MANERKVRYNYTIAPDRQIRIRNVPAKTVDELKNVCQHIGISMGEFCKSKLIDWLSSVPDHYKKPMED